MMKLNPHTLIFVENYVIFYSGNLSLVRYNHFEERIKTRKMSQVKPRSISETGILQENSLSKESRVQPSIVKLVTPLMRRVIDDMSFDNTTEAVVKSIEITERAFAKQMSGQRKKEYVKELLSGIVKEEDPESNSLDDVIDLVVTIAKNKELHKLFKRSSVFCLSCCKNDKN